MRSIVCLLCVTCLSCSQQAAETKPDPISRLNDVSAALDREERTLNSLEDQFHKNERYAAWYVFQNTLPKGLTTKGLNDLFMDPREGSGDLGFEYGTGEHSESEKENLKLVRAYADEFAEQCKRPESDIAKTMAQFLERIDGTPQFRRQQELVDKLRRQRDEAQTAVR